ncbi:MAG: rhodanese-like domain-containing protein [Gammaproteobacteria bacterium]
MNRPLALLISSALLGACSGDVKTRLTPEELLQAIESDCPPVVVDVRSESEFLSGHVPGALHIPFWSAFTADELSGYQAPQPIVVYCEHGPRAAIAKFAFGLAGFENIYYLEGHMAAWRRSGLPVERGK